MRRLQKGVKRAAEIFSFYPLEDDGLVDAPLLEGVVPAGGASDALVRELERRVGGWMSEKCVKEDLGGKTFGEMSVSGGSWQEGLKEPRKFVC